MRFGLFSALALAVAVMAGWFAAPASAATAALKLGQAAGVADAASTKAVKDAYYRGRHRYRGRHYRYRHRYRGRHYRGRHRYRGRHYRSRGYYRGRRHYRGRHYRGRRYHRY